MNPKIEQVWVATVMAGEPINRYADILLPICTRL